MSKLFKTHERMAVCSVSLVWNIPSRMNFSDVATRMHRPSDLVGPAQHPQRLPQTVPRDHSESKIKIKSPADCWIMSEAMRKCAKLQWKAKDKSILQNWIILKQHLSAPILQLWWREEIRISGHGHLVSAWYQGGCPQQNVGFPTKTRFMSQKKNWKEESKKLYNCLENNANCW